mmetsp:Transcript_18915/g.72891  ORF Transcript_18915/g.72891 Transcript_18915/m.72891 type:complete len:234 (-) Transcript_18915:76-777(-)
MEWNSWRESLTCSLPLSLPFFLRAPPPCLVFSSFAFSRIGRALVGDAFASRALSSATRATGTAEDPMLKLSRSESALPRGLASYSNIGDTTSSKRGSSSSRPCLPSCVGRSSRPRCWMAEWTGMEPKRGLNSWYPPLGLRTAAVRPSGPGALCRAEGEPTAAERGLLAASGGVESSSGEIPKRERNLLSKADACASGVGMGALPWASAPPLGLRVPFVSKKEPEVKSRTEGKP